MSGRFTPAELATARRCLSDGVVFEADGPVSNHERPRSTDMAAAGLSGGSGSRRGLLQSPATAGAPSVMSFISPLQGTAGWYRRDSLEDAPMSGVARLWLHAACNAVCSCVGVPQVRRHGPIVGAPPKLMSCILCARPCAAAHGDLASDKDSPSVLAADGSSTLVPEPTVSSVPDPVILTPVLTPPGQTVAPVGVKKESLVSALWGLDRCAVVRTTQAVRTKVSA